MSRAMLAAITLLGASSAFASFNSLVVFGDSLSDMGNVSNQTLGFSPGANYWQGRYSNGPVWIENFASSRGLALSRSTATGGNNFAYGGATTGSGNFGPFNLLRNMRSQVDAYLAGSPTITGNTLYVLWAGGNDYLNGGTNPAVPIGNISGEITRLWGLGARNFLIPNLPLLGNVPRNFNTPSQGPANALSAAHNGALRNAMSNLRSSLTGANIYEMDVATEFETVRANPSAYGLTNVTSAALVNGNVAPNVDEYLFYDDIHPTRRGHAILGNLALRSVPEPASMLALGVGLAVLLRRRKK